MTISVEIGKFEAELQYLAVGLKAQPQSRI